MPWAAPVRNLPTHQGPVDNGAPWARGSGRLAATRIPGAGVTDIVDQIPDDDATRVPGAGGTPWARAPGRSHQLAPTFTT